MKRLPHLERYIYRHFGVRFNVYSERSIKHYAAYVRGEDLNVFIDNKYISDKSWLKQVLWHEMGHFFHSHSTSGSRLGPVQMEVEAHQWALDETRTRGYSKIHRDLRATVTRWTNEPTENLPRYRMAAKILREINGF